MVWKLFKDPERCFLGFGEGHSLLFSLDFPIDRKTDPQDHKWKLQAESSPGEVSKDLVPWLLGLNDLEQSVGN